MVGYGGNSGITTPLKATIRDAASLQAFWAQHAPASPVPSVDWSAEMVLAYVAGPGGISNRVMIRGEIQNGVLVVRGEPARPVWWDANVSPYCIVVSNRNDLTVVWQ
jgi:hypothetical protein